MRMLVAFVVAVFLAGTAMTAQAAESAVLKVPCRDMGDGRTLIDGAYLPDSAKNARYTIIATRPQAWLVSGPTRSARSGYAASAELPAAAAKSRRSRDA